MIAGSVEVAAALVGLGVPLTPRDDDHMTVVHLAAKAGNVRMLRALAGGMQHEFTALVDDADRHGKTPLHWAAYLGHRMCVEWLLAHGGATSIADDKGCHPVHWAACQVHITQWWVQYLVPVRLSCGLGFPGERVQGHYAVAEALAREFPEAVMRKDHAGSTAIDVVTLRVCCVCVCRK